MLLMKVLCFWVGFSKAKECGNDILAGNESISQLLEEENHRLKVVFW